VDTRRPFAERTESAGGEEKRGFKDSLRLTFKIPALGYNPWPEAQAKKHPDSAILARSRYPRWDKSEVVKVTFR